MDNELKVIDLERKVNILELMVTKDKFTARQICRLYAEEHDYINWHEFSDYLSRLHDKGLLVITGHDISGMCIYRWNR